jgi:hypothetical protein
MLNSQPGTVSDGAKPKLDLQLATAYSANKASCYYCGVCLVDGPEPDFEVAYLAVIIG